MKVYDANNDIVYKKNYRFIYLVISFFWFSGLIKWLIVVWMILILGKQKKSRFLLRKIWRDKIIWLFSGIQKNLNDFRAINFFFVLDMDSEHTRNPEFIVFLRKNYYYFFFLILRLTPVITYRIIIAVYILRKIVKKNIHFNN